MPIILYSTLSNWKKTYLFFIPYTIITILVIVNVSYSRFFYTYMPPILYGEFNNLDGLSANVFATIRFSDITILITTLASILSYKQFHRAYSEIRRKTRRIFFPLHIRNCIYFIRRINSYSNNTLVIIKLQVCSPF